MLPEGLVSERTPGGKKRVKRIGGSDWQHIVAPGNPTLYKYGCLRRLFYEKSGVEMDFPWLVSKPMKRGKILEKIVAEIFQKDTGCRYVRKRPYAKELWPGQPVPDWWEGTLDRLFHIPPDEELKVLECKTMGREKWFDYLDNGLDDGYKLQPQHYMGIIENVNKAVLAVVWPDGIDYMPEPMVKDMETIRLMLDAGEWFWKDIMSKSTPPERLPLTEQRCGKCPFRYKCLGKGYFEEHIMGEYALDDDTKLYLLLKDHREAKDREKAAAADAEVIAIECNKYLEKHYPDKDPEKIHCRDIEMSHKKSLRSKTSTKDAKAESSEVAKAIAKHTSVYPLRTFSTKITKKSAARWEYIQDKEREV